MMRLFTSPWTASLAGLLAYLTVFAVTWRSFTPPWLDEDAAGQSAAGPSWTFQNTDLDLLIEELKQEKKALSAQRAELDALSDRLRTERAELLQLTQTVHQIQADFDQSVTRVKTEETANLKRLAKMYAAMSPDAAASLLKTLDDCTVTKVLMHMKDSQMAALLEVLAKQSPLDAKRAAVISEKLRLSITDSTKPTT